VKPLLAVVLIGVVAAAAWLLLGDRPVAERLPSVLPRSEATAAAPDPAPRTRVAALGRLEPRSEVIDVSSPQGSRVLRLETRDGARVARGDVLAVLDGHPQQRAARDAAAARLAEARALHAAETEAGEAAIALAEIRAREVSLLTPLEIRAQDAEVRRLEAELGNARRTLTRLQRLRENSQATEQSVDDERMRVEGLRERIAAARHDLDRLRARYQIDSARAEAEIRSARAALERARAAARVESHRAELARAEADLENATVRAPIDGTVLKILTRPGERVTVEPILKLGDTDQMYVVAEVDETDARFVAPGQHALIESPALPAPIHGAVESVSALVYKNDVLDLDPAARVDARVVEVRIRLEESGLAARFNNLQVRVGIVLDPEIAQAGDDPDR